MTKVKISKEALQTTLNLWKQYLSRLEAGEKLDLLNCPVCTEVVVEARKKNVYVLGHIQCKRYCPFHGRICCDNAVMHKRSPPLFWKFISFLYTDTSKAIKYAKLIIKAIQDQLEVSS